MQTSSNSALSLLHSQDLTPSSQPIPAVPPGFTWWPSVLSQINVLNYREYAAVQNIIASSSASQQLLSRSVASRSGPGFTVVYLRQAISWTESNPAFLATAPEQNVVHIGDYVSLWHTSTPSHPQFWLEAAGQVTAYKMSRSGYLVVTVAVSSGSADDVKLVALSLRRREVDLSGAKLLWYTARQSFWTCGRCAQRVAGTFTSFVT